MIVFGCLCLYHEIYLYTCSISYIYISTCFIGLLFFSTFFLENIQRWRSLYDSVNVDEVGLGRVRTLLEGSLTGTDGSSGGGGGGGGGGGSGEKKKKKKGGTVIFVPTHRSYVDFIILSYIFFAYNMPLPYIAAGDWMEKMGPLASMMKVSVSKK